MNRFLSLVIACAGATLIGCGGGTTSPSPSPTPNPSPTSSPTPLPSGVEPTDWALAAAPSDETISIRVASGVPECWSVEPLQVNETDDTVTIAAFTRFTPPADGGCDLPLVWTPMDLHLNQPLGERRLEGCDGSPNFFIDPPSPGLDCRSTLQ